MRQSTVLLSLGACVFASLVVGFSPTPRPAKPDHAIVVLSPAEGSHVRGVVHFVQGEHGVVVQGMVTGLEPNSVHGFHIHEFGNVTSGDGSSLGGHYNPSSVPHGLPGAITMHAGDMGNITADAHGTAQVSGTFSGVNINGENSVLGRGVVVHANPDDGGQPTGNAGGRIAFGVIGVAKAP